jgi:hypothetical protein
MIAHYGVDRMATDAALTWRSAWLAVRRFRPRSELLITLLVAVGCVLRLRAWSVGGSLWLDEVYLALNITGRSFAGLWQPLDYDQGAPVGFLMLVKAATALFGEGERALRLVPLAAGLLALLAFPRVARAALPATGAAFAVALVAVSPKLISYSAELKQYSSDALITVLLGALTLPHFGPGEPPRTGRLALAGAVAVWFSHPALFVLAGWGLTLFLVAASRNDRPAIRRLIVVGAAWLASFAVCWWFCLRSLAANHYLLSYWNQFFAPAPPRSIEQLGWYVRAATVPLENPGGMLLADVSFAVPAALLFGVGLAAIWVRRPGLAVALVAPLAITLVASAGRLYPFGGRLLLFATPLLYLGLGAGAAAALAGPAGPAGALSRCVVAAVALAPAGTAVQHAVRPKTVEDHRAAVAHMAERWQPGDRVIVSGMARAAWRYYGRLAGLDVESAEIGRIERGDWNSVRDAVALARGRDRVWAFVAHERYGNHKALTWQLDQVGRRLHGFAAPGTAVYLYETHGPEYGPALPPDRARVDDDHAPPG